ncbi:hypothetical protein ['Paenibacillus yunnanensis' Narsing Rao et al. 2020]|uniref:hypothetical protein n=1 Tax=Paenibacillus tengchongensis TaxID=2608684 RepID=UPI0016529823|nr:hypothetical protein [Paenibacillus tengchongensis]
MFTENGQDYLVGWSSNNYLYVWEIRKSDQMVVNRVDYRAPLSIRYYSRGGWDGDRYVYFWNRNNNYIYRWDLRNKSAGLTALVQISGSHGLDSSYSGSGLYVSANYYYWGSGANETDGLLGLFNRSTGAFTGTKLTSANLSSIGAIPTNGAAGCIFIDPTQPGIAYYTGFTSNVKTLALVTLVASNVVVSPTIHDQAVTLQFDVVNGANSQASSAAWRISVNGQQRLVSAGYLPLPSTGNQAVLANEFFNLGSNTIAIEMFNEAGAIFKREVTITVTNNQPSAVTMVSKDSIHDENVIFEAVVTDEAADLLTYRILLNGAVYSNWSVAGYNSPLTVRRSFRADELANGSNIIKIEVKDNFKTNTTVVSAQSTVTKVNTKPTVSVEMKGNTLYMAFDDADGDRVRFKVLLNNEQVLPASGYSMPFPVPGSLIYTLPKNKVKPNQSNTIKVEVIDSSGDTGSWSLTKTLGYSGLMFRDAAGAYYSTDLGELLKRLNLGVAYAGESSSVFEMVVENTLGYPVKNIVISGIQGDLDPDTELIEFSLTGDPFTPSRTLTFPSSCDTGEAVKFYVRVNCSPDAVGGGNFKIRVTGDPL